MLQKLYWNSSFADFKFYQKKYSRAYPFQFWKRSSSKKIVVKLLVLYVWVCLSACILNPCGCW